MVGNESKGDTVVIVITNNKSTEAYFFTENTAALLLTNIVYWVRKFEMLYISTSLV